MVEYANALTDSRKQGDRCDAGHFGKPSQVEDGFKLLPEGFLVRRKLYGAD